MATRKIRNMSDLEQPVEEKSFPPEAAKNAKPEFARIMSQAKNQREVLEQIKALQPEASTISVVTPPLLSLRDAYFDLSLFTTAVSIALAKHGVWTTEVRFLMGPMNYKQVRIEIPGSLNLSRTELADVVSRKFVDNPKAVGFSLRKEQYLGDIGASWPWAFYLFLSDDTRVNLVDKFETVKPELDLKVKAFFDEEKAKLPVLGDREKLYKEIRSRIYNEEGNWEPSFYVARIKE